MGKIRVATLGSEEEKKLREKQKIKREEKKKREAASRIHLSGMKGGQRVKSVGAQNEEEIERMAKLAEEVEQDQKEGIKTGKKEKNKRVKKVHIRSKKYKEALMKVDHGKLYKITDAIPLLRQISLAKFDSTVELHINTIEKGLRGTVRLPHGTGKQIKVMIVDNANIDKFVETVGKGMIDFDALVAHPQVLPKLAKVAKYLGPKGLMPNPKAGTISTEPEKVAEKIKGGEISWKTEAEFPIIHQVIGKLSFKDKQLEENFYAIINSIGANKIKSITLKSTMSPGIKIDHASLK